MQDKFRLFRKAYPRCSKLIPGDAWQQLVARAGFLELFGETLGSRAVELGLPEYLGDLARMELHVFSLLRDKIQVPQYSEKLTVNPTLQLFDNAWRNLACQVDSAAGTLEPVKGREHVIVWINPASGRPRAKPVQAEDLLAMKMAIEELSIAAVVRESRARTAVLQAALTRALEEGVVLGPEPLLKRPYRPEDYHHIDRSFFEARIFTLQWHITQACDLHCRHCYDRSQYGKLSLAQEIAILDDLAHFSASHNVHAQVSFTGGNPLLHPNFATLYQEAADRGFSLAILGNPASREQLTQLCAIQPPAFYQVSLEGLEEHNDFMRGRGHFKRVLAFLELLREFGVFSMVMLTLTRDNLEQVLPLAEILRDKADLYTFNRLSLVGEGANLAAADKGVYPAFLRAYDKAAAANPCLGMKDNLFNIHYHEQKRPLFGGCTGFGCGAAFNFITVLSDGSVHACRKLPSPLGNILDRSLAEIYQTETARKYRAGAAECRECPIRPVCGGCLAVAHSNGRDIFTRKDPYCFIDSKELPN